MSLIICLSGFLFYENQKKHIKSDIQNNLSAIAALKIREVVNWRRMRWNDGLGIQQNPFVAEAIEHLLQGKASPEVKEKLLAWMKFKQTTNGYQNLLLFDGNKTLILAANDQAPEMGTLAEGKFDEVMAERELFFSNIHREETDDVPHLDMLVPIIRASQGKERSIGMFLLRCDPREFLYPLIQSWPTPSPTGETLLVSREGGEVVFLNELRHQKNTALRLRFPAGSATLPAARGVQGFNGVMEGLDYRNVPVIAVVRAIPASPWYLVAKVDATEVELPVRDSFRRITLWMGMIIVLGGAIVVSTWRSRQLRLYRDLFQARLERETLLKQYEYLTRYANDIILMTDATGRIGEANERAVQSYGYDRETLLDRHIDELMESERHVSGLTGELDEKNGLIYEAVNRRQDGSTFFGEVSARGLDIEGKKFYQYIIRDVTSRKEAIEALNRSEEEIRLLNADLEKRVDERTRQLEEANRELEAFSYSVSHDLRAPLRSMDGFSQALLEDYENQLDATAKDYLFRIRSASQLMGQLIDDILRLSRVTRAEMKRQSVDLSRIVREASQSLQQRDPGRQVEFVIQEGIEVMGDRELIKVALWNLLENAWKFTSKLAIARIEFGTTAEEGGKTYFIRDNGAGFDMEYRDKLFNVFQRLHSSREFSGTGVGLATVKRIVLRHGGTVWAEGAPGKGATVYFRFD